jgi:hypothetical protein
MMRSPNLVSMARVLAWGAGYGAALMVAYHYAALPAELPLSRWTVAPKNMFFALRVPLINLAMIGLSDLLARALIRAPADHRLAAERSAAALLCTAGIKSWLAAKQILSLPDANRPNSVAAFIAIVVGVSVAAWFARPLLGAGVVSALRSTRFERVLGALLLVMIVVLNLPLVALPLFL